MSNCSNCKYLKVDEDLDLVNHYCSHPIASDITNFMSFDDIKRFGCVFHNKGAKPNSHDRVLEYISRLRAALGVPPNNKDTSLKFAELLKSQFGGDVTDIDHRYFLRLGKRYYGINGEEKME